ncbi:MAG: hypothetical protein Q9223_005276, partial [Gallowayella weberi]
MQEAISENQEAQSLYQEIKELEEEFMEKSGKTPKDKELLQRLMDAHEQTVENRRRILDGKVHVACTAAHNWLPSAAVGVAAAATDVTEP